MPRSVPPMVLVLAGHDPSGGAGIIADSEAIKASGGWALTVPTALTVQDCHNVQEVMPVNAHSVIAMVTALETLPIAAIKLGLIADTRMLETVEQVLRRFPGIPVVADPVLKAGGGAELSTAGLSQVYVDKLMALIDVLTPNREELARLTPDVTSSAHDTERVVTLMEQGCGAVLVTATDTPFPDSDPHKVVHTLHTPDTTRQWQWPRLSGHFHGSGCTLASSLATRLAVGERLLTACEQAQHFTWQSLLHGYHPDHGQALPDRFFKPMLF